MSTLLFDAARGWGRVIQPPPRLDPETNKSVNDQTTVIYPPHLTVNDISLDAYYYVVNGKPAIEWVMERQSVSKDNVQRHHQRR